MFDSTSALERMLNNYGFSKHQLQTQPEPQPQSAAKPEYNGSKVFEIRKKDDLTYVKPDSTGAKQIILCEEDNTIYIARYNYAKEKPDYEEFISKGDIKLPVENTGDLGKIADILANVVTNLSEMKNDITELKTKSKAQITKTTAKKAVSIND